MKKIVLTSIIAASSMFAATDAEIKNFFEQMVPGHAMSVEVEKRTPIPGLDGFEEVIYKVSQGDFSQKDAIYTKGDFIAQDLFNIKTKKSYKEEFINGMINENIAEIYKKEEAKNIIKLGNDPKKETLIMLSDADCPFCKKEMASIEDNLKENNYEIIMTSIHGPASHAKSAKIYEEASKAKNDADKIKVLKKYYADNIPAVEGVDQKEIDRLNSLAEKYFKAGVQGVPFIVNKKELIK